MTDLLDVAASVIAALEHAGVPYSVGGSLASSFAGEPRASVDADILVRMTERQVPAFLATLGNDFYADADALRRAVANQSSANLIHQASGIKVDLFVARTRLDARELERRQRMTVAPGREWYVHSPEDILLQKLLWFREGGEVSDRQWRDVLAILLVQRNRLDVAYLTAVADEIGVLDLLQRAQRATGEEHPSGS
ncbi:MAG: hypothetical protein FJW23_08090 [Acidimicrobiia bacterium]|nr:hypothetical protein [Acidimicrobiia bacterium]